MKQLKKKQYICKCKCAIKKSIMKKNLLLLSFLFFLSSLQSQTFSGGSGIITDDGTANDFSATVAGLSPSTLNSTFGLVQVCLNINHSYDADLSVFLVSPDGTTINLFSGIGGADYNFTATCLSQSASASINTGVAPFTGTFKPQETIGNANNNQNGNGVWKLRIYDGYPQDQGTLTSWSITFGANAPTPIVFSTSNLPIVLLNTFGSQINDATAINATMKIIDNGVGNMNSVTDIPNNYNGIITIKLRGAYSSILPQKPYKIETVDASNASLNTPLLGMPTENDWSLIANYNDKVFMRNNLAYKLFEDMGHYAPRNEYCEVVLNGSYQGIYLLSETIKRDSQRVNISKLDVTENSGINLTGGYIIKNDYWDATNSWLSNYHPIDHPELDVNLVYEYPKPGTITTQQQTYIQNFINDFETALYSPNFADPINGYRKYISTASFIDYFIVNELSRNNDGFKKSSYFHKDKNSNTAVAKLKAGPVWDFDWAWKNINECSFLSVTDGSGWSHLINDCGPDVNSSGWYVRLLQDPIFQNEVRCRWEFFRTTILSNNFLNTYIDDKATYLDAAQVRHFEKWGNLGVNTGAPEVDPIDPPTFAGQVTKFKNWIATRIAWLDANIPGTTAGCTLSINNQKIDELIKLFPNPTSDYLNVSLKNNEIFDSITLYDATGKLVLVVNSPAKETQINVSLLANGIYVCKIKGASTAIKIQKIVVLH